MINDIKFAQYYRSNKIQVIYRINEYFLKIPNYDYYLISNYGRVYNSWSKIMITPFINRNGYIEVKLNESDKLVHRLELIAFNPILNYDKYDVNHIDGNKYNNFINNLEWCTRSENLIHAFKTGLSKSGELHLNSIYSNNQVEYICKCLEQNNDYKTICKKLNIQYCHNTCTFLNKIKMRKSWKQISQKYNF